MPAPSPFLYLHYPICKHHCSYCDFNVFSQSRVEQDFNTRWLETLSRHFSNRLKNEEKISLKTIYLGGGTPSLLSIEDLGRLTKSLSKFYDFSELQEFTIECNPENIRSEYIRDLKGLGVNRVSLGVQSFRELSLKRLERLATFEKVNESLELISSSFENFSFDLMLGVPEQALDDIEQELEGVERFRPPHLSVYLLGIPEDHKWHQSEFLKRRMVNGDSQVDMFLKVQQHLQNLGYKHYEVSNYSKAGFHSLHNSNYWDVQSSYEAFGPGAHGYLEQSTRYQCHKGLKEWMASESGVEETEILDENQRKIERIYLALRSKKPLLKEEFDTHLLSKFLDMSLIEEVDEQQFMLPERAWPLLDSVVQELVKS